MTFSLFVYFDYESDDSYSSSGEKAINVHVLLSNSLWSPHPVIH